MAIGLDQVFGEHTMRLALVMIVRDEARCIGRCLESVKPHVDTMIVLDTGSTDDTVEIAQEHGAILHRFAWCDDFAAARNAALDHSDADWNLILDADDWITNGAEGIGPHVLPPASVSPAGFVGCLRIVNDGGSAQGVPRSYIPRVLPRSIRYEGRIHEQPMSSLPRRLLSVEVRTDGYAEAQLARKAGRNEAMLRADIATNPGDPYLWYQLGREQLYRGITDEAADHLLAAYQTSTAATPFRHGIVIARLQALTRAERFQEALALAEAERRNWPHSPDFYFAVGALYLEWASHNPDIAMDELLPVVEGAWKRCLDIGEQPDLIGSVEGCGSYLAAQNLAMFYQILGIEDESRHYASVEAKWRAHYAA